jgi:hypothetical protein
VNILSLNFVDNRGLITQDAYDVEYMSRRREDKYMESGLLKNVEIPNIYVCLQRLRIYKLEKRYKYTMNILVWVQKLIN